MTTPGKAPALSPEWYRVAELRPRLRSHVRMHRHEYRGEPWYVLEDRISRRTHRLDRGAYLIAGLMDGRYRMQEICDAAMARLGDEAPTQDEIIRLLGQLHLADVMQCEVSPDVDELLRRSQRLVRRKWIAGMLSPLAIRIPLFDPDALLERGLPWYRPLFAPVGALLWLIVVGWGALAMVQHWDELTQDITHRVLAPENLLVIGVVFPLVKALHEFGHACAVKAWGGEVHEMGIMLLVLMPIPYVDATAANAFPEKRRRVLVGAAGMVVELFLASLALFVWLEVEPGLLRAVLFNVMLIAGVSTVLFNANPLLRFDGYYMLADIIEIPNLRQRSTQYLSSVMERRLLGVNAAPPECSARERVWFVLFAIASFVYRMFIIFAIALFIAGKYFLIGVALAIWAVIAALLLPAVKLIGYLALHPRLRRRRFRASLAVGVLASIVLAVVFLVPVPLWTTAQGVIAVPERSIVRAGTDGFIRRLLAVPGSRVRQGDPLVELADPMLPLRVRALEARREELEARYQAEYVENKVRAQIALEELRAAEAALRHARERAAELTVHSPSDGVFVVSVPRDMPDRFMKHGEQMGYVLPDELKTVTVIVPQQTADLVRTRTAQVEVKLAERLADTLQARVKREVPAASDRLPSPALSQAGGGDVALDPQPGREVKALQTHFEFEIEMPTGSATGLGGRVYVRFEHGTETLSQQVYRSVRQLFLQRLAV